MLKSIKTISSLALYLKLSSTLILISPVNTLEVTLVLAIMFLSIMSIMPSTMGSIGILFSKNLIQLIQNKLLVHIGREDMPYHVARSLLGKDKIIGVTVHTLEEAKAAQGLGADYLGVSPIFTTATKLDAGKPCGVEVLKAIRQACNVPIVAIGGIDLANIGLVIKAGADMACAISAVVTKPDVRAEILKFQKEFGL